MMHGHLFRVNLKDEGCGQIELERIIGKQALQIEILKNFAGGPEVVSSGRRTLSWIGSAARWWVAVILALPHSEWREAWKKRCYRVSRRNMGLKLISDNGCQPSSGLS
jgi:hypothetical protein